MRSETRAGENGSEQVRKEGVCCCENAGNDVVAVGIYLTDLTT